MANKHWPFFAYLPSLRSGIMLRASPGDRGRRGEIGLLARRARSVWLALLVVAVALPGATEAQNSPGAAGDRSSFGSQLRNPRETVPGEVMVR